MAGSLSQAAGRIARSEADDAARQADFLLSRNDYHVIGRGRETTFDRVADAATALRGGAVDVVVGAVGFDVREAAALVVPERLEVHERPWMPPKITRRPIGHVRSLEPSIDEHRRRVAQAVAACATEALDGLGKVVLARRVGIDIPDGLTAWGLAAILRERDPRGSVFVADLSPAGRNAELVGATPEVLIRKRGRSISAHPLAGSAPRSVDPQVDAERGRALAASHKDRLEHRYVVDAIHAALAPLCSVLDIPDEPELMTTPAMWHLGTPIRGEVADSELTALDLALALHPTPAVCGTPTLAARDHILRVEEPRGFYAGTVGWARRGGPGEGGDGEWMVTIRCVELNNHGTAATTWAGGGIVAESDPETEVTETEAKLATILGALGIGADERTS